jgi:hypothetical protein
MQKMTCYDQIGFLFTPAHACNKVRSVEPMQKFHAYFSAACETHEKIQIILFADKPTHKKDDDKHR